MREKVCLNFLLPVMALARTFLNIIEKIESGESTINSEFPEKLFNKTPKEDVLNAISTLVDDKNIFSISFDDYSRMVKTLSDFVGNCNNTILFRNFVTDKGRNVCYINKQIDSDSVEAIKNVHSSTRKILRALTPNLRMVKSYAHTDYYSPLKGDDIVIKSDISAFFRSVKFENVIKYLPKTFFIKNLFLYSMCKMEDNETKKFERIEIALWAFFSCLFHNGIIPTGAQYSNDLAKCYLNNLLFHEFDKSLLNSQRGQIHVYVDDILVISNENDAKAIYSEFEKAINRGGLYLNYKKTQYFYPKDGSLEYSALGINKRNHDDAGVISKVNSKARKKCLDIIKDRRDYNESEKGIINYALYMKYGTRKIFNPDIIMHSYFNDKSQLWDKLLSGDLRLKINQDIFNPVDLKYKDICIMAKDPDPKVFLYNFNDPITTENVATGSIKEFVKLFISDNPFGYSLINIDYFTHDDKEWLMITFGKISQGNGRRFNICPLFFKKGFLNSLYLEENLEENNTKS